MSPMLFRWCVSTSWVVAVRPFFCSGLMSVLMYCSLVVICSQVSRCHSPSQKGGKRDKETGRFPETTSTMSPAYSVPRGRLAGL
jgi:hypothetical protein